MATTAWPQLHGGEVPPVMLAQRIRQGCCSARQGATLEVIVVHELILAAGHAPNFHCYACNNM